MSSSDPRAVVIPPSFEIHGHRGARGRYPENTIAGFVAALEDGADTLETDLLLMRDDEVVIHHNYEPNPDTTRASDGSWVPAAGAPLRSLLHRDLARHDIGRLRPGSEYAAAFPHQRPADGARIPTLREALVEVDRASGGRARWNLEIKIDTRRPERTAPPELAAEASLAIVRELGLEERTMIQSFDWRVVRRIHALAPDLRTGCLTAPDTVYTPEHPSPFNAELHVDDFGGSVPRLVHAAGAPYWTPHFRMITADDVAEAHRLGLRVVPWTVNEPEDLRAAVALGVDGVITDYPERLARS